MKKKLSIIFMLLFYILIIFFVNNNYFIYDDEIMKIIDISDENDGVGYGYNGIVEDYFVQNIKGEVLNGDDKGKIIELSLRKSSSLVYDEDYNVGDNVFINKNAEEYEITGFKRDTYVVYIILIFIIALLIIGKFKGLLAILSLCINIVILLLTINLYLEKGINLILLSCIAAILFTFISMFISIGLNKKALVVSLSTLVSVALTTLIAVIVMIVTKENGVRMEQMEFLLTPYKPIFISEVIFGGMGAVMDISITIASTVSELVLKNNKISKGVLYSSCKEIGKDTMGTMLNVILFTFMCTSIPKYVLFFRNGISIDIIFSSYLSLDIARSLIAGIAIVGCIPISSYLSIKMIRGNE